MSDLDSADISAVTGAAKDAARLLARASATQKNAALEAIAAAIIERADEIISANGEDMARGRAERMPAGLLDRLELTEARLRSAAAGVRELVALPDPVGRVLRGSTMPNGLRVTQRRVPLGVIGMIYEARPNVTIDATTLCLKAGNAVVLRGGSAAEASNRVIIAVMGDAVASVGLPREVVQSVDRWGRAGANAMMVATGGIDVLIPRGGAGLIASVVRNAQVPVIETGVGNCHVYVDAGADLEQAENIIMNSKTQRVGVCNAAETLLVHRDVAPAFLSSALTRLTTAGVRIHGDEATVELAGGDASLDPGSVVPATDEDWATEYLSMDLAVRVVDSLDQALEHIQRWSTGHTEAICTRSLESARRFTTELDSAALIVNASTRFTDGGQLGLGAEIGISTQKLHARGPMGLEELTSSTWIVEGEGQIRA